MELLLDCLVSALFIGIYLSDARKAAPIAAPAPIVTEEPILAGVTQYMAQAVAEFTPTLSISIEPDAWETEPGRHPLVEPEWELESDSPTDGSPAGLFDTTAIEPIELLTAAPIADTTIEPTDAQPVTPLERMTLKQLIPIAKHYKLRTANVRKPALLAAIKAAMAE